MVGIDAIGREAGDVSEFLSALGGSNAHKQEGGVAVELRA